MTENKKLKQKLDQLGREIAADSSIADEVMERLEELPMEPVQSRNFWRTLMKSRMTKLGTAAAILIIVGIISLLPSSPQIVTPAFAMEEIIQAMKSVPWMHMSSQGYESSVTETLEMWYGFEDKIFIFISEERGISFIDYKNHRNHKYNAETNTITTRYLYEDDFPLDQVSPWAMWESQCNSYKERGGQVITSEGEYHGRKVQIQEISLTEITEDHKPLKAIFYIDLKDKLLLGSHVQGKDAEGDAFIDSETTYQYPKHGPEDLYALGAPQNAKIIEQKLVSDIESIWDAYRLALKESPRQYILIATESKPDIYPNGVIRYFFKNDWQYRSEMHSLGYKPAETSLPKTIESLNPTFENLMQWWQKGILRVDSGFYLYDGKHTYTFGLSDQKHWEIKRKHYSPKESRNRFEIPRTLSLGYYAWPHMNRKGTNYSDDYSKENNLVAVEYLQQASIYEGQPSLPGRFLYYLDPEHDYICRRKVTEWRPDASWQEDLEWDKGVDPEQIRDGSIQVTDVIEYDQTDSGHWYPQTIEIRQSGIRKDYQEVALELEETITIYLEVNPDFPEGAFDADKILGTSHSRPLEQ